MKTIKLGELCDINPKDALPDKGTLVSFIPMQRVSETGQVDATETRQSEEVTKGFSSFREGDILMAKITPCMENGKGGIAKGLCNGIGYGSTEFHVIRPTSPLVRTEWIYYYTTYPRFRKLCEQNMTGSAGQKRVPKSYLLGCPIPVPNLNTQDKVIHSLRSLRSIIEHRRAQLAKLDELVKCRFVELFGDPGSNPRKWPIVTVQDIVTEVKYGTSRPAVAGGKYPYLRMNNITYDGKLDLSDVKRIDVPDDELPKCTVKRGDILFNRTNSKELVGKTCLYDKDELMVLAGFIIRVRVNERVIPEFVVQFMNMPTTKALLFAMCRNAVSQANINAKELQNISIYLPSLDIQKQFSAFTHRIDKLRFK